MDLYEYQGKALFKEYKIPIPKAVLMKDKRPSLKKMPRVLVLKAQVLHGRRRKSGLILFTTKKAIKQEIKKLRKKTAKPILIEEKLKKKKEYYLSISVNQSSACFSLLFSEQGGINVEEIKKNKIKRVDFLKFPKEEIQKITKKKEITAIAEKLFRLFIEKDATLVEINPLIETQKIETGKAAANEIGITHLIAGDAKVTIDNNALYRHAEFETIRREQQTKKQKEAEKWGIHYVELNGNIGVIGNGAGLVMATLDMMKQNKLKPANFLDAAGGTTKEAMKKSLEIVAGDKRVACVFINMFGGITETDDVAEAIVAWREKNKRLPLIVRLYGTHYQRAHEILKKNNIIAYTKMHDAIDALKKKA